MVTPVQIPSNKRTPLAFYMQAWS